MDTIYDLNTDQNDSNNISSQKQPHASIKPQTPPLKSSKDLTCPSTDPVIPTNQNIIMYYWTYTALIGIMGIGTLFISFMALGIPNTIVHTIQNRSIGYLSLSFGLYQLSTFITLFMSFLFDSRNGLKIGLGLMCFSMLAEFIIIAITLGPHAPLYSWLSSLSRINPHHDEQVLALPYFANTTVFLLNNKWFLPLIMAIFMIFTLAQTGLIFITFNIWTDHKTPQTNNNKASLASIDVVCHENGATDQSNYTGNNNQVIENNQQHTHPAPLTKTTTPSSLSMNELQNCNRSPRSGNIQNNHQSHPLLTSPTNSTTTLSPTTLLHNPNAFNQFDDENTADLHDNTVNQAYFNQSRNQLQNLHQTVRLHGKNSTIANTLPNHFHIQPALPPDNDDTMIDMDTMPSTPEAPKLGRKGSMISIEPIRTTQSNLNNILHPTLSTSPNPSQISPTQLQSSNQLIQQHQQQLTSPSNQQQHPAIDPIYQFSIRRNSTTTNNQPIHTSISTNNIGVMNQNQNHNLNNPIHLINTPSTLTTTPSVNRKPPHHVQHQQQHQQHQMNQAQDDNKPLLSSNHCNNIHNQISSHHQYYDEAPFSPNNPLKAVQQAQEIDGNYPNEFYIDVDSSPESLSMSFHTNNNSLNQLNNQNNHNNDHKNSNKLSKGHKPPRKNPFVQKNGGIYDDDDTSDQEIDLYYNTPSKFISNTRRNTTGTMNQPNSNVASGFIETHTPKNEKNSQNDKPSSTTITYNHHPHKSINPIDNQSNANSNAASVINNNTVRSSSSDSIVHINGTTQTTSASSSSISPQSSDNEEDTTVSSIAQLERGAFATQLSHPGM